MQPTVHDRPSPRPGPYFQDLPYTEWVSQRWTYQDSTFSTDWPSFPEEIDSVRQMVAGKVGGASGLWLLTESQLFFARNMYGGSPESAKFDNISQQLDLDVSLDSFIVPRLNSDLYLVSSFNVTYLDCKLKE